MFSFPMANTSEISGTSCQTMLSIRGQREGLGEFKDQAGFSKNVEKVRERSAQRDRLLQRREKKDKVATT